MKNKILALAALALAALALTACGQPYTAVSPAEAELAAPHYDLVVEVLSPALLSACERSAEAWAPVAAILCVDGPTGQPDASLSLGCDVPEKALGWYYPSGLVCVRDTDQALGCDSLVPHEIGHALGAAHQPQGEGLMASPSSCTAAITDHDLGLVAL
jgi:hypothetical protein